MRRYLIIDWELSSVWATDDIEDINSGGSCRWGDPLDMIKVAESILDERKEMYERERKEIHDWGV